MSLDSTQACSDDDKAELFNQFLFSVYLKNLSQPLPVTQSQSILENIELTVPNVFEALISLDCS